MPKAGRKSRSRRICNECKMDINIHHFSSVKQEEVRAMIRGIRFALAARQMRRAARTFVEHQPLQRNFLLAGKVVWYSPTMTLRNRLSKAALTVMLNVSSNPVRGRSQILDSNRQFGPKAPTDRLCEWFTFLVRFYQKSWIRAWQNAWIIQNSRKVVGITAN